MIAELVVTGQVEQIQAYLDLFKQYPDAQPDDCHQICNGWPRRWVLWEGGAIGTQEEPVESPA